MRPLPLLGGILACAALASCVSLQYERNDVQTPIPAETVDALRPGADTLEVCLERLGAPLFVWELNERTFALAYGWNLERSWGVRASVPVRPVTLAVTYQNIDLDLHGVVLVFDQDDRLLRRDRGYLRDIAPGLKRRPPAYLEDRPPDSAQR